MVDGLVSFRTDLLGVSETFKLKGAQDTTKVYGVNNYFYDTTAQTGVNSEGKQVDASWFANLDTTTDVLTRNADGTINMNGLLQLTETAATGSGAVMGGTPNTDYSVMLAAAQEKDAEKQAEVAETPAPTAAPTEELDATAVPTETPDDIKTEVPASSASTTGIIVVVAIAVIAVAAVVAATVRSKKKKATK